MAFERIQKQSHTIEDTSISVSYDRFTTRFEIKSSTEVIYSSLLLFFPIRNAKILINNQEYSLKILWFLLWRSKLTNSEGIVVKELLYRRRKKSIGLFIYFLLITMVKIGIGLATLKT